MHGKLILECPNLLYACQMIVENPAMRRSQVIRLVKCDVALVWRPVLLRMCHKINAWIQPTAVVLLEARTDVQAQQEPAQFKLRVT